MEDFQQFWSIYQNAFPPDERRDLQSQKKLLQQKNYHLKPFYQGNMMVGFIAYWNLVDFLFVEHLAVEQQHRGKGYGRGLITDLITEFDGDIILEVEYPEDETSRKRIKFYEVVGFKLNNIDYLQPSYGEGKEPVPLLLMSYPDVLEGTRVEEIVSRIYGDVYGG